MEVILRDHVDNVGKRGDVVKVADGFARNYLLPRKLALEATEANKHWIARERKIAEAREGEEREAAEALAERLVALDLQIARKVGDNDTLYGSVTNADIAELLKAEGLRHRSPQDLVARCAADTRRIARAGEVAPRRDGAAEDHDRQRIIAVDRPTKNNAEYA